MNRPYLLNFSAIQIESKISLRISLAISSNKKTSTENELNHIPIRSIKLFNKSFFRINLIGRSDDGTEIINREYDSNSYGKFEIIIPRNYDREIVKFQIYETSLYEGVNIYLGSYLLTALNDPVNLVICDFDKTLVDTKYHTARELYYSLNKPLNYFPSIDSSIKLIKEYIESSYQPFILSASPHFYENAIRNWLYQNNIYTSNIYLKDYRDFISIFDGAMTTKDLKQQGFYKLSQLVDILSMTGIPNELVLIGDGFESDPFIYLTLRALIKDKVDPWKLWSSIKNNSIFNLTSKQNSYFLTKFYKLSELSKRKENVKFNIHIRATEQNIIDLKSKIFKNQFLKDSNKFINYYV